MKRRAAVLGATGVVGQRIIDLMRGHPNFEVGVVSASERSAGKKYRSACSWLLESEMPKEVGDMTVADTNVKSVEEAGDLDIVFSSLPASIAGPVEAEFAKKYPVFSKASAHRLEEDVPLLVPEVNPNHLDLIPIQKKKRDWQGFISTDPNCSTIQLVITLKPLMPFKPSKIVVATMQALSGAGYPGVASMDIIDNVIPYIADEEGKLEAETLKILGSFDGAKVRPASLVLSASCNRVNVKDGHMEWVFIKLDTNPTVGEVKKAFENFRGEPQELGLHSAPKNPIIVREETNRPQPRFDRDAGAGMSIVIGRIQRDPVLTAKYLCLGHNTVRGAAGASLLSAELADKKGYLK